ncbi:hypothetical protein [Streptomyces sp. NPDC051677]|uniref:hypothetical protein n=1 Tax=Streptomyces sp. NPDC051677 TaxID=3365669 RepID=UPI0037D422F0
MAAFVLALTAITLFQFLAVSPVQAASSSDCPGGSSSGTGPPTCPNLANNDLLSQRRFPAQLYRGDTRQPYDIFTNGFTARGTDNDIQRHVHGGSNTDSNYISTSGTLGIAEQFARSAGQQAVMTAARQPRCSTGRQILYTFIPVIGQWLLSSCVNGTVTAESFVYVIDPQFGRNALYIPDEIRHNADLYNRYAVQDEWAYVHRIPRDAILGVRMYRTTARVVNGLPDFQHATFRYDRFAANPHHAELRISYDPDTDPNSHFNWQSWLNTPPQPANPYTRGCSEITRCRGGGN